MWKERTSSEDQLLGRYKWVRVGNCDGADVSLAVLFTNIVG
jgi:hypothetical protein